MTKKLYLPIALLMIFSMLLSACASAAPATQAVIVPPTIAPVTEVPPTPVPPAPPSPIVSLAQAIAWADKGLGALPSVMLRAQAEQAVSKALTANWPAQHK